MKKQMERIATNRSFDQANEGFSQLIVWGLALLFIWWAVSLMSAPLDDTFSKPVRLFHASAPTTEPTLTVLGWVLIQ